MSARIPSRGRRAAPHWMTKILVFPNFTFYQSKIQRVKASGTRLLFILVGPLTGAFSVQDTDQEAGLGKVGFTAKGHLFIGTTGWSCPEGVVVLFSSEGFRTNLKNTGFGPE